MHLNDHVEDCAQKLEGNWRKFSAFDWFDKPEDADGWCVVYTHNRDSDALERSNAHVIAQELEKEEYEHDVRVEDHNHWAVGWVKGYAIRVRDAQGEPTKAFTKWVEFSLALEDYPVLDESHFSDLEYQEACAQWADMTISERVYAWRRCSGDFHLMACRRDELPQSETGALTDYLNGH